MAKLQVPRVGGWFTALNSMMFKLTAVASPVPGKKSYFGTMVVSTDCSSCQSKCGRADGAGVALG